MFELKILDRGDNGCNMCRRIPVLNDEDKQWLDSGQPLQSLVMGEYDRTHQGSLNSSGELKDISAYMAKESDAVNAMNSAMDNLEALFGFDTKSEIKEDDILSGVTEADANFDHVIYQYDHISYLCTRRKDYPMMFCPFCGNRI